MKVIKRVFKVILYIFLLFYIPGFLYNLYDFISHGCLPNYVYTEGVLGIFILLVTHPILSTFVILHYLHHYLINCSCMR